MRIFAILSIVIAVENAALYAICIAQRPENEYVAGIYLSWMIVPALTAAIASINRRWSAIATGVTSIVSAACWDYLVISGGLFWDQDSSARTSLAIIHAGIGVAVGVASLGFVRVIVNAVESSASLGHVSNVSLGMKKGVVFGSVCSGVAAILYYLLRPAHSGRGPRADMIRQQTDRESLLIAVVLMMLGTLGAVVIGALVGRVYRRKHVLKEEANAAAIDQKLKQAAG